MIKEVLEPFTYTCSNPGKNIRSIIIHAFQQSLQIPNEALDTIIQVIDMLHNSSLMIDDIQDSSTIRRGQPAAHLIYGVAQTINSANLVYFLALEKLVKLNNTELIKVFSDELVNLHKGQGYELYWRDNHKCPTQAEYIEMINHKTGGLFRLAIRLMQTYSTQNIDYVPLANLIGIHFQIRDDYINLISTKFQETKGFAEDLTEGKFSFPVVHHLQNTETPNQLLSILKQRTTNLDLKKHAIKLMETSKSFEFTREFLVEKEKEIYIEIENLGGLDILTQLFDKLQIANIEGQSAAV
ncbi:geranylgeranyl pyrophosphate synthase [Conidiobolus coronatus NRRL 28638]|uniref:Geranylgeranyl pyrophosphate synthase n=1 Tax=Conidiobolus coronatus (strain ATCC 28846 / CBS 209.66 / NRRL 28638) TaxID=796925 RepID=A0A137PAR3_CONC2|nr:geranylgeranyl pyrophosphate synthase [Conidiobolus coronatus NRRL 28638]|eukprot:KXN72107.1 geranylgeranyl pyrophosphate synthase [Conidiobolus coronatus NRRL 28638]